MNVGLDPQATAEAVRRLDLRWPVNVAILHLSGTTQGYYTGSVPGVHAIVLRADKLASHNNLTLWHELGHARQVEDAGCYARFQAEYQRQKRENFATATYERLLDFQTFLRNYENVPYERACIDLSEWMVGDPDSPRPVQENTLFCPVPLLPSVRIINQEVT